MSASSFRIASRSVQWSGSLADELAACASVPCFSPKAVTCRCTPLRCLPGHLCRHGPPCDEIHVVGKRVAEVLGGAPSVVQHPEHLGALVPGP